MAGSPFLNTFTPSSSGRRGFLLRAVTRLLRPRVISTTCRSAALCSLRSGAPPASALLACSVRFSTPPWQRFLKQSRRVSLGKALQPPHIPSACISVRFAGYWISPIHDCSILSPIPFRRFAVRYVRRFYLMVPMGTPSPTRRFCSRSCLVGVVLPSGNGGQFYFRCYTSEHQLQCRARHTWQSVTVAGGCPPEAQDVLWEGP